MINKRKVLSRFFIEQGVEIDYIYCNTRKHECGKSFDNDGTYKENVYKLTYNGDSYYLTDKITGRSEFFLLDINKNPLIVGFNQKDFINRFENFILNKK